MFSHANTTNDMPEMFLVDSLVSSLIELGWTETDIHKWQEDSRAYGNALKFNEEHADDGFVASYDAETASYTFKGPDGTSMVVGREQSEKYFARGLAPAVALRVDIYKKTGNC